ncbi:hypothetical protein BV20DRAFT_1048102 [Pilatotrama ljubarskyi]|nr:hypothetical protein BV20DRAFT_1048102 [Pilatotrama ljubarskyi]
MSILSEPLVAFTNSNSMIAIEAQVSGAELRGLAWIPVHMVLAMIAPGLYGLVMSKVVASDGQGTNLCASQPVPISSILIAADTIVTTEEMTRTVSFLDGSGSMAWHRFHIRFHALRDYWSFVGAVTDAKGKAEERHIDIHAALGKVLDAFPRVAPPEGDDSFDKDDDFSEFAGND